MRTLIRRIWRIISLALHLVVGVFLVAFVFGFYSPLQRDRTTTRWAARLLRILHVRSITSRMPDLPNGALLVANHVSWLDIFVLLSARRVHFVSKHEVRAWPVIGWLAHRVGTLFIERAKKSDTARINQEMHALLLSGAWVAVFPEGTSTNGSKLLPFLPSLFQPAVSQNLPVVPVALDYVSPDDKRAPQVAYSDDISFTQSLWNICGESEIRARLNFLLPVSGSHRRELAERAHHEIASALGFNPAPVSGGSPAGIAGDLPDVKQ